MEAITDGDLALTMVLTLLEQMGKAKTLPAKKLDIVLTVGLDLVGRMPEEKARRKRLQSYRAAWTSPKS